MKRSWFARHPIGFMALYTIFYLSVFHYLEANVPLRSILVHCRLDDLIPFCKYAVIPYFAWFVWIPFTLFYLLWKAPREDFWRLCLPLFSGMTIALACYAVLPTALDLRPYWVPGSDIFAQTVRFLYRTDTATNVCPSIHVFNSVTLLLAYYRSRIFDAPRRRWMRPAATVLCVSIVCSTVLLKQHSCIDVALGALLALVLAASAALPVFAADTAPTDTIYINSVSDLLAFADKCGFDQWSKGKTVILQEDLSLEDTEWAPVASFSGAFKGNGHTISDVSLVGAYSPAGFFGILEEGGSIQDLTIKGVVNPAGTQKTAGGLVGGLIRFNTEGLDFVMTAMFVVIFLNQWEKEKQHASAIIGIAAPLVCLRIFGSGSFLIPSMVCILVALLLLRRPIEAKESEAAK